MGIGPKKQEFINIGIKKTHHASYILLFYSQKFTKICLQIQWQIKILKETLKSTKS